MLININLFLLPITHLTPTQSHGKCKQYYIAFCYSDFLVIYIAANIYKIGRVGNWIKKLLAGTVLVKCRTRIIRLETAKYLYLLIFAIHFKFVSLIIFYLCFITFTMVHEQTLKKLPNLLNYLGEHFRILKSHRKYLQKFHV